MYMSVVLLYNVSDGKLETNDAMFIKQTARRVSLPQIKDLDLALQKYGVAQLEVLLKYNQRCVN